jgi:hypothetical protein
MKIVEFSKKVSISNAKWVRSERLHFVYSMPVLVKYTTWDSVDSVYQEQTLHWNINDVQYK